MRVRAITIPIANLRMAICRHQTGNKRPKRLCSTSPLGSFLYLSSDSRLFVEYFRWIYLVAQHDFSRLVHPCHTCALAHTPLDGDGMRNSAQTGFQRCLVWHVSCLKFQKWFETSKMVRKKEGQKMGKEVIVLYEGIKSKLRVTLNFTGGGGLVCLLRV